MVLAIDQSGPAGILPAGYSGEITIDAGPDSSINQSVNDYTVSLVDPYQEEIISATSNLTGKPSISTTPCPLIGQPYWHP